MTALYGQQQSEDTSPEWKDDNVGGKNTDEESKLLMAYLDEASQVDKKILLLQHKNNTITHPLLNVEVVHTTNKSLVEKIRVADVKRSVESVHPNQQFCLIVCRV